MKQEEFLKRLGEIAQALKENGGAVTGLRRDDMTVDLMRLAIQGKQNGHAVNKKSLLPESAVSKVKGRYSGVVKDLVYQPESSWNGVPVKAIDLFLAKNLMEMAPESKKVKPSEDLVSAVKAMSTTAAGAGAELVQALGLADELWFDFFAASSVYADLPEQIMVSDPQGIPTITKVLFNKGTENTAETSQDLTTGADELQSTEMIAEVNWSYSLEEDAVLAMMPAFRQAATKDAAELMDAFALNADDTNEAIGNVNLDDANPDDNSYFLTNGQDGIRHAFLVDNTAMGVNVAAALDGAKLESILKKLGKYRLDLENCRIVPDVQTFLGMIGIDGVKTIDEYGPYTTVVPGEMARYRGIPILPSLGMPLTEADGKVSSVAANNTKGQLAAYNRQMWRRGQRRGVMVEFKREIRTRKTIMVITFRIATACRGDRTAQTHTAGGYNITVA